jgi:hypothetical protein
MVTLPALRESDLFDEDAYLRLYPGLQDALDENLIASLWQHYNEHGRREGRRISDLDPEFYLRTYPQITEAFGKLTPMECAVHHAVYGRARGYLPYEGAPRDRRVPLPPLGGSWTDAPDARDVIDCGEATGRYTDRQSESLRQWLRGGFFILDRPLGRAPCEQAALDIDRIFAGACPDIQFECPALANAPIAWQPELTPLASDALDVHYVSRPIRAAILSDVIEEFLTLLFDTNMLLASSRGFLRQPAHPPRRASALFGCSVPRRFATVVICLDDSVSLSTWPGSHRIPSVQIGDSYPSCAEAVRLGAVLPDTAMDQYDAELTRLVGCYGLSPLPLCLRQGQVAILHPDLVWHGTEVPILATARGIRAELCPDLLMPVFAERTPCPLYQAGRHRFLTGFYTNFEPLW